MELSIFEKGDLARSDNVRERIAEKVAKLEKHASNLHEVRITLSVDKNEHIAEANIHLGDQTYHAKAAKDNMYKSIDVLMERLERQVRDYKSKHKIVK